MQQTTSEQGIRLWASVNRSRNYFWPNQVPNRNALRLKRKSLTTLITADPNLPVTQPVEISIGYFSAAGTNGITQSYVRTTGNRFLYNDNEGDGKPRSISISISLREPILRLCLI
ncbi:hypothetical protein W02_16640 [Nitrospira sp. KM1]|uniref:hypothetical protein n=1 Tax=Nitrospira sp. KM1 TaxID=1936990 RepID=UPI0013A7350F|nr:hypothetical protein [Nitrospira sp. KM1]BCA54524.1 hypothetical protein W02_16640 [Nitrospira sp. KM1]